MLKRTLANPLLKRALLTLLVAYTLLGTATYDGMLDPQRRLYSVILIGVVLVIWLWNRRGWSWHRTALDWAILLWCAAFALSLATNLDAWRRIVLGLWYMGIYIGLWYILQDMIANEGLERNWLIDALLITGVPVVFVGFAQVEVALTSGQPLPRPGAILGNPNSLAAFLVMLVPFAVGRLRVARSPLTRVLLGVYTIALLGLIGLSFSRGGWIAVVAALAVWVGLSFPLRQLWTRLPRLGKIVIIGVLVLCAAAGLYVIVQSFGIGGRGIDVRTWIYQTAIQMFSERPVAGYGLFTFGSGLARLNSLPPYEPHSHAHNIILHVAAEMGVVGLLALALTAFIIARGVWRARDPIAIMGAAAFTGFVVHQLFDIPAMMPTIALVALIALVLCLPSGKEVARARLQPALIAVGGLALAALGVWNALNYRSYVSALSDVVGNGDYQAAADRLQTLADADPSLAIYPQQQGLLLGLAAAAGDSTAAQEAAQKLYLYTRLDPNYVSGWANLAAIYEATGQKTPAVDAMQRAVQLAPLSWPLIYRLGVYAEAAGDNATAQRAYQQALKVSADLPLLPDWDQSPVRSALPFDESTLSGTARTLLLLERGDVAGARQVWENSPERAYDYAPAHVMNMLIALASGDRALAETEWKAAERGVGDHASQAWADIATALLNDTHFDQEITAARAQFDNSAPFASDWGLGANINYIQNLVLAIPRQFLPQVGFTEADPALLHLLDNPDALAKIRATIASTQS